MSLTIAASVGAAWMVAGVLGQLLPASESDDSWPDPDRVVIRHDEPSSTYEVLADDPRYDSAGWVNDVGPDGPNASGAETIFNCSAVLIAPNWVLTAAHCLNSFQPPHSDFETRTAYPWLAPGQESVWSFWSKGTASAIAIDEVVPFPEFTAFFGDGMDIMLCRLRGEGSPAQPTPIYRGGSEVGSIGTIVGYGDTGDGQIGDTGGSSAHPAGVKRAATNMIDGDGEVLAQLPEDINPPAVLVDYGFAFATIVPSGLFCPCVSWYSGLVGSSTELVWDFDDPDDPSTNVLGDAVPLALEGSLGGKDSGGPVYIEEGSQTFVAGINSNTGRLDPSLPYRGYGNTGTATRVSSFQGWIDDFTNNAAWEPDCRGSSHLLDDSNWRIYGERRAPTSAEGAVFALPMLAGAPGVSYQYLRNEVTVSLDGDAGLTRLRVRRGTDLSFNLQGHMLSLTSMSEWTTSLVVGELGQEYPILRLFDGVVSAWDASLAERSGQLFPGGCAAEIIVGDAATLFVEETLYLSDRKPTLSQEGRFRVWPGRGTVTVEAGGQLVVGSRLRLGRANLVNTLQPYDNSVCIRSTGSACVSSFGISEGSVVLNGGTATIGSGATESTPNALRIWSDGLIEGCGRIVGNVINSGGTLDIIDRFLEFRLSSPYPDCEAVFDPSGTYTGGACRFKGRQVIEGSYSQESGAQLRLDIAGTNPEIKHDVLEISGTATLAGSLNVGLDQGFVPAVGNVFDVVTASTVVGTFEDVEWPTLPAGLRWTVGYPPGKVRLAIEEIPFCMGDASRDGFVDFDDINAVIANWLADYGADTGLGDADGNGVVNFDDINGVIANWLNACP